MSGDISGFGAAGTGGATPVGPNDGSGTVGPKKTSIYDSTLSQSELEQLMLALLAGFPQLQSPTSVATSFKELSNSTAGGIAGADKTFLTVQSQILKSEAEIIDSMWDAFQKGIKEAEARSERAYLKRIQEDVNANKPMSGPEYQAFLMSVSLNQRTKELDSPNDAGNSALAVQFNATFNQWLVSPVDKGTAADVAGAYPSPAFIAAAVAIAPDNIRAAIGGSLDPSGNYSPSMSPVADAIYALGPASALPADYQAAAALVASILNGGAMYKATSESLEKAATGGQPPRDVDFAINYAKNILAIVTHDIEGGQPISEERAAQNRLIRLMLTTMALTMLYRAVYGGMNSEEMMGLLRGDKLDLPDEVRQLFGNLVAVLKRLLPSDAEEMLAHIRDYVDSKDPLESMLDTTRIFVSLLSTQDVDNKRLASDNS